MARVEDPHYQPVIFIVLLSLMIPSIICSIYLFYQFIRIRILRTRINNHVVLLLLIVNFILVTTELPLNMHLLRTGRVPIQSYSFCIFWNIYNFSLVGIGLYILTYGCIERYLCIFYRVFFNKHLIILHYIPLAICIIYPTVFYVYTVGIYACKNNFTYDHSLCGRPCYEYEQTYGAIDWIGNLTGTVAVSILASLILLVRVISQKLRIVRNFSWRRNRLLVIQLLSISLLYIVVWVPILVCFLMVIYAPNLTVINLSVSYLNYYQYVSMLLYPFICVVGLKEVQDTLKQQWHGWFLRPPTNTNRIQPTGTQNLATRE